jgi:hypothetical protein
MLTSKAHWGIGSGGLDGGKQTKLEVTRDSEPLEWELQSPSLTPLPLLSVPLAAKCHHQHVLISQSAATDRKRQNTSDRHPQTTAPNCGPSFSALFWGDLGDRVIVWGSEWRQLEELEVHVTGVSIGHDRSYFVAAAAAH